MKNLLTPPSLPSETVCRTLKIPSSKEWLGIFNALLLHATKSYNWEQVHDTDLTPDECAAACYEIYEQWLGTGLCPVQTEPPYWEDAQDVGDDDDDGIPWYDELGDWFLTGFLAITFTPTAGIFYKTFVPKARVALRRGDWGALFKVLINGLEYVTGDSYSAVTDILEIDLDIEAFAIANGLGAAPWDLQIKHNGTGATSDPNPRLEIVRKRLSEDEVTAITDIQQVGGQLQIQRGNIAVWQNVPNADNVRRDGSTIVTGDLTLKAGTATGQALNINPNAAQGAIRIQLPIGASGGIIRALNNTGTPIFEVFTNGRFKVRASDSTAIIAATSDNVETFNVGTLSNAPILQLTGRSSQTIDIMRVTASTGVLLAAISQSGAFRGRGNLALYNTSSIQERQQFSLEASWITSTDALREGEFALRAHGANGSPVVMRGGMVNLPDSASQALFGVFGEMAAQRTLSGIVLEDSITDQIANALETFGFTTNELDVVPVVSITGDTGDNEPLKMLLDALAEQGLISNDTISTQEFDGELTPDNTGVTKSFITPKQTILGEFYTITVKGLITYDGGAIGYADPLWEGASPSALTGSLGHYGKFRIDGVFQGGVEPVDNVTHQYTLDPFAGTGDFVIFSLVDYEENPTGHLDVTIEGKFIN